jgi:hypothetical protein
LASSSRDTKSMRRAKHENLAWQKTSNGRSFRFKANAITSLAKWVAD